MIDYGTALARILEQAPRCETVPVPLSQAWGNVLGEAVRSPAWLPPFDHAAMDGYALATNGEALPAGTEFAVAGLQTAGQEATAIPGCACEITTGAPIPEGFDTVVPYEQIQAVAHDDQARPIRIRLPAGSAPGRNIRQRGEDVSCNEQVMAAGEYLRPQHIALLAALGISRVPVVRRPRVALIATGRELVSDPEQPLAAGQIHDSNTPYLLAQLVAAGAQVVSHDHVTDDADTFLAALDRALALDVDVLLSTGAVSRGRFDFVPAALHRRGAEIGFHRVAIRPGKPLLFARLPAGPLYFGLPGNPISSAAGLRFFVEPALRAMLGLPRERPLRLPLESAYRKREGLRCLLHARLVNDDAGCLRVRILPDQASFRLLPVLQAQAWVALPESVSGLAGGERVDVHGLNHLQPPRLCQDMPA